jgi:hypothetical protein
MADDVTMRSTKKPASHVVLNSGRKTGTPSGITTYRTPRGDSVMVYTRAVYEKAREAAKKK